MKTRLSLKYFLTIAANVYLFKVNKRNTRKDVKYVQKTPERRHSAGSGVLLLTLNIFHNIF